MKIYIYTLKDPVNNIVAYVGESVNPDVREKQHQVDAHHPINYFPFLNFPVTSSTDNWKQWLGYMGIIPVMTIIDSIVGTKADARKLERQYIAKFTENGIRLCNDFKAAKELPCPYRDIWSDVWTKYEALKVPVIKPEKRFPELLTIESDLIQKVKMLDAIRAKLREEATNRRRTIHQLVIKQEQEERDIAHANIIAMFASQRALAKTVPLLPAPRKSVA